RRHLFAYCVAGLLEVGFGVFILLKWVGAVVWQLPPTLVWYAYRTMWLVAFGISSFGMLVIWEAAREFLNTLAGKVGHYVAEGSKGYQPHWKLAPITLVDEITALTGYPEVVWNFGTLKIKRAVAGWAWLFWLGITSQSSHLPGGRWLIIVMIGTILPWMTAFAAVTRGVVRVYWIFNIILCAGFPIVSVDAIWMDRRWLFETWSLAVTLGILLVGLSNIQPAEMSRDREILTHSPEQKTNRVAGIKKSSEILGLFFAGICFVLFLVLVVPDRNGVRELISVMAGVACLLLAGLCLGHRKTRRESALHLIS
ncbi:MAG: hypothetical protein AB1813_14990, partial [Verrucomicrobiota bacterium]